MLSVINVSKQIENIVEKSLADIKSGSVLLAAVSGGADSTAMLASLVKFYDRFDLHCIHINHNLRNEESLADAAFVESLCKKFNVPCKIKTVQKDKIKKIAEQGIGTEAAARLVRHKLLRQEAKQIGADKILIAHNKDDVLENILLRLLRGSGPAGLAAMPQHNGIILRPLISVRRIQILEYLKEQKLSFCKDSSNESDAYLRNRIRGHIIPVLNNYFPNWESGVEAAGNTQRLVSNFLTDEAEKIVSQNSGTPKNQCNGNKITITNFSTLPKILKEESIFYAIDLITKNDSASQIKTSFEPDIKIKSTPPRRSVIRKALCKTEFQIDLGRTNINLKNNDLTISAKKNAPSSSEGVLLIQKEGIYHYKAITIKCIKREDNGEQTDEETSKETSEQKGSLSFRAKLPLLFRMAENYDFTTQVKLKKISGKPAIIAQEQGRNAAIIIDKKAIVIDKKVESPPQKSGDYLILLDFSRKKVAF
jgi:tRNA(Ile)-lysidine synthase